MFARPALTAAPARALSRPITTHVRRSIPSVPALRPLCKSIPTSLSTVATTFPLPFLHRYFTTDPPSAIPTISYRHRVVAGVVLIRSPQIIRDLTPFERAYFAYQQKLDRVSALSFPAEFYFKKGSVAERRWRAQEAARNEAMKSPQSLEDAALEASTRGITPEEQAQMQENEIVRMERETEADRKGDRRSLDRALQRSLYLIVKKPREEHAWQFPQGGVEEGELLHEAAQRELTEECGPDMDIWFVGRTPIGYYKYPFPDHFVTQNPDVKGAKVFFMKAHIFAGQARPDNKEIEDYAWVTKQELTEYVSPQYYKAVKNMLSEL